MALAACLAACSSVDPVGRATAPATAPSSGHRSAQQILDPLVDDVQEAVALAGGAWKYPNGQAWDGTNRDVARYGLVACTSNEQAGPVQYTVGITGGGVADPVASAARFAEVWRKRGYVVQQLGPTAADATKNTGMSVPLPDGAKIGYQANTRVSSINALSECSSNADLLKLANGGG